MGREDKKEWAVMVVDHGWVIVRDVEGFLRLVREVLQRLGVGMRKTTAWDWGVAQPTRWKPMIAVIEDFFNIALAHGYRKKNINRQG